MFVFLFSTWALCLKMGVKTFGDLAHCSLLCVSLSEGQTGNSSDAFFAQKSVLFLYLFNTLFQWGLALKSTAGLEEEWREGGGPGEQVGFVFVVCIFVHFTNTPPN